MLYYAYACCLLVKVALACEDALQTTGVEVLVERVDDVLEACAVHDLLQTSEGQADTVVRKAVLQSSATSLLHEPCQLELTWGKL